MFEYGHAFIGMSLLSEQDYFKSYILRVCICYTSYAMKYVVQMGIEIEKS